MPVTLAQAKLNTQDDIQIGVIDEFRKNNFLLENITFDDAVTPGTNGATLTYGYTRLITQPTAAFRAINTEYTPQEVTKARYTADLKVFGGSYQIDRVLANVGGLADEVVLQSSQKIKAAQALFNDTVINGDSAAEENAFDGLAKAVIGTSTDFLPLANGFSTGYIDLSTADAVDANWKKFLDAMDEFLALLDGRPSFLGMNSKLFAKLKAVARRAGYHTVRQNEWGATVDQYDGIPLIDLGAKPGTNNPIVQIATRDADGAGAGGNITGLTDLFAVRLGLDGFHGISMAGVAPVQTWLPDFARAGAVKTGEVEMVAAVALKATKAAGRFANLKVQ